MRPTPGGPIAAARLKVSIAAALALFCLSCAHVQKETGPGETFTAVASWYGDQFHGRRTASGETFDMERMTAAHRTLPFGTRLSVTYPPSGRSAVVVVNDRGPFVPGRDLDLSKGAASAIGLLSAGVGKVRVEVLGRDGRYVKYVRAGHIGKSGSYRVQVGSFIDPWNAEHLKLGLDIGYSGVRVIKADVRGETYHRVQVGAYASRGEAERTALSLAREGYDTLIVRQ